MNELLCLLEEDKPIPNWKERDDILNIADIIPWSKIHGPGERAVIWFQGCPIRCKGCWNPHLIPDIPNHLVRVDKLAMFIKSIDGIEGITLVGGEPLYQGKALLNFIKLIKSTSNLTIMLYTGYNRHQIRDEVSKEIVRLSDIIVFGPYIEEKRDLFLKWRGSSNQEIVINNKKYINYRYDDNVNEAEIHITEDGEIILVGFPDDKLIELVKKIG